MSRQSQSGQRPPHPPFGHLRSRGIAAAAFLLLASPALAQEAGWHYSPYDGEGDRAAMGCATGASPEAHACVVVRCEDDHSVAVYIETSRAGGDAGQWALRVDDANPLLVAEPAPGSPYGARILETDTSIEVLVNVLKLGDFAYLDPIDGGPISSANIPMSGSLYAINQALYFCAPKVPEETEPQATR